MILLRPLLSASSRLQNGRVMSMQPAPWPEPDPVVAAAIRSMYGSRKAEPPLAVTVRDRLGEWLRDEDFAAAFGVRGDRKSTRLNSSHQIISYAVFCLKKKK